MKISSLGDIAFSPISMKFDDNLRNQILTEIETLDSFYSDYRTCEMIPIYTPFGLSKREEIRSQRGPLSWTSEANLCPTLVDLLQSDYLPLLTPHPRIFILKSLPFGEVKVHTDCSRETLDQPQFKLRLALSGDIQGLWFLSESKQRRHISSNSRIYFLDGAQPHGMINNSEETKYTVCLGSPWQDEVHEDFFELIKKGIQSNSEHLIKKSELYNPNHFDLFQEDFEKDLSGFSDPRDSGRQTPIKP